jgi:hypothetical protein
MAFSHGSKAALFIAGSDVSSAFTSATVTRTRDTAETSGLGATAKSYIAGLDDATVSAEGMYEAGSGLPDEVLSGILGSASKSAFILAVTGGATVGDAALAGKIDTTSYEVSSPVDGVTAATLEFQTSDGAPSGKILRPKTATTTSGDGTALDNSSSTANGLVAVLQVLAISGTTPSITVGVEHSADNITYVALGTFTAVTSGTSAQVITTTGTVNRYLRATWSVSGTTPSATIVVAAGRK